MGGLLAPTEHLTPGSAGDTWRHPARKQVAKPPQTQCPAQDRGPALQPSLGRMDMKMHTRQILTIAGAPSSPFAVINVPGAPTPGLLHECRQPPHHADTQGHRERVPAPPQVQGAGTTRRSQRRAVHQTAQAEAASWPWATVTVLLGPRTLLCGLFRHEGTGERVLTRAGREGDIPEAESACRRGTFRPAC